MRRGGGRGERGGGEGEGKERGGKPGVVLDPFTNIPPKWEEGS